MWWIILYIPLVYIGIVAFYFLVFRPINHFIKLYFKHDFSLLDAIKAAYDGHLGYVVFETLEYIVLLPFFPFALMTQLAMKIADWFESVDPKKLKSEKEKESESKKFTDGDFKRISRVGLRYRDD
jgi:hypothetical protein